MKQSFAAYIILVQRTAGFLCVLHSGREGWYMIQEQARTQTSHRLTMQDRAKVELTGVTEVISFDNEEIILETVEGGLRFGGEELHVKRLTLERGEIAIEGRIREIAYQETGKDKSFFGRLFR